MSEQSGKAPALRLKTQALEYFIRREIVKKMQQEQEMDDAEAMVYQLPFKMKVQDLMENNKAMDERTKKDKEKMEKEAQLEIETNFPSYFEEFQTTLFSGIANTTKYERKHQKQVKTVSILREMLHVHPCDGLDQLKKWVRLRAKLLRNYYSGVYSACSAGELDEFGHLQDCLNLLREDLRRH